MTQMGSDVQVVICCAWSCILKSGPQNHDPCKGARMCNSLIHEMQYERLRTQTPFISGPSAPILIHFIDQTIQ